jgi:hypothetical protein
MGAKSFSAFRGVRMAILIRLAITALAGLFTYVTKKVPWLSIVGVITTVLSAILTVIQIYKEAKALGWIS